MAALEEHVKIFVTRCMARYMTPTETAAAVKEAYDIDITRQQAQSYDPLSAIGRDLSAELRAEFETERTRFRADIDAIPCADATYRLSRIQQVIDHHGRNPKLVLEALEQAAKERGEAFTNKRVVGGVGEGGAILVQDVSQSARDAIAAQTAALRAGNGDKAS